MVFAFGHFGHPFLLYFGLDLSSLYSQSYNDIRRVMTSLSSSLLSYNPNQVVKGNCHLTLPRWIHDWTACRPIRNIVGVLVLAQRQVKQQTCLSPLSLLGWGWGMEMEGAVTHEPPIHLSSVNHPTWMVLSAAVVIFLFAA